MEWLVNNPLALGLICGGIVVVLVGVFMLVTFRKQIANKFKSMKEKSEAKKADAAAKRQAALEHDTKAFADRDKLEAKREAVTNSYDDISDALSILTKEKKTAKKELAKTEKKNFETAQNKETFDILSNTRADSDLYKKDDLFTQNQKAEEQKEIEKAKKAEAESVLSIMDNKNKKVSKTKASDKKVSNADDSGDVDDVLNILNGKKGG